MKKTIILLAISILLSAVTEAYAQDKAEDLYKMGKDFYQKKQYKEANIYFHAAVIYDQKHWQSYQAMGNCDIQLDDKVEAVKAFEKSLKANPNNPTLRAYVNRLKSRIDPASLTGGSKKKESNFWARRGLKLGYTSSTISGIDKGVASGGGGINFGGFLCMGIKPNWAIQPEVFYVSKGNSLFKLGYLEIPLLAKYALVPFHADEPGHLQVFAGPVFNVLFTTHRTDSALAQDYNSTTYSLTGGAEYLFQHGLLRQFSLEVRYEMGLSSVAKGASLTDSCFQVNLNAYLDRRPYQPHF